MNIVSQIKLDEKNIDYHMDLIRNGDDFNLPSNELLAALVAGEDRRFQSHRGFDVVSMLAAIWGYLRTGKVRGASTIEMQLVRTLRCRYEITVARKITEIYLAFRVAKSFSKSDIARAYLIVAYFGWKANGIRQAAFRFNLDLQSMNIDDASRLVALLKYPLPKKPTQAHLEKVIARANYITRRLEQHPSHFY